ncbi:FadR/GntR family transcriptional regulator [Nesterenkonia ebinurensis]|uniref:FadR/GntR family transcriptional regulator n=1 Tax=Nesterenkonia ebinurensis TaxID=2608252 RepID=UPI001CC42117|nr:GntR family transcriptional regulator [Nesterenkonia ebinurensis]
MHRGGSDIARRAHDYLRRRIASGDWPVNSRIPTEAQLMEALGVGKSTVREAVRSLVNQGMLETMPGIGTFVRSRIPVNSVLADYVSYYPVEEVLGYRRALEIEAAQLASAHRGEEQLQALRTALSIGEDDAADSPAYVERGQTPGEFHVLIFEAAGNELMTGLYAGVMAALRQIKSAGQIVHGVSAELRHEDHLALYRAVAEQDVAAAAHAAAFHVDRDLVPEDPQLRGELAQLRSLTREEAAPRFPR